MTTDLLHAGAAAARGGDGYEAGRSAASQALEAAGGQASAAIVFASVQYAVEHVRAGAASVLGDTPFIGCSGSSIITSAGETAGAVGVLVMQKTGMAAVTALLNDVDGDFEETERRLDSFSKKEFADAAANLILVDGLAARAEATMHGARSRLGVLAPTAGGCASDGLRFTGTYQFDGAGSAPNGAALMRIGGLRVGVGVRHGYCCAGSSHVITGAHDNTLETIDGAPAVEFYGRYFDDAVTDLRHEQMPMIAAEYPLGVRRGDGEYIARDVMSVNARGHLTVAGGVTRGDDVSLMMGTREDLLDAAEQSARDALAGLEGAPPRAALLFNCMGRHKVFGSQAGEEIRRIVQVVGAGVPLLGFYTYGEIAPMSPGSAALLHNKSAVIVLFS